MATFLEKSKELDTKRQELMARMAEFREDGGGWKTITPGIQKEFVDRNAEIKTLSEEVASLETLDKDYQDNVAAIKAAAQADRTFAFDGGGQPGVGVLSQGNPSAQDIFNGRFTRNVKTLGEMFTEAPSFKSHKNVRAAFSVDLENFSMKTLFQTTAGFAPFIPRIPDIVPFPNRQPVVADLMPQTETDLPGFKYMEITTWTNAAASVAEGATKPEATVVATERTATMIKLAVTLPVTDEQMDDVPMIRSFIENTLMMMVMLEEDRQLLLGNGTTELQGINTKAGINTQAKGADDRFTAALKLLTKIRAVGFANPSAFVMNPTDWTTYQTQQDGMGRFILGDPGAQTEARLWGLPVVQTVGQTLGTVTSGDWRTWAHIYRRLGLRVDAGYVNDQFNKNQMTLRAEERLTLAIFRALAFGILTGV